MNFSNYLGDYLTPFLFGHFSYADCKMFVFSTVPVNIYYPDKFDVICLFVHTGICGFSTGQVS